MSNIYENTITAFREKELLSKQELVGMLSMSYEECINYLESKKVREFNTDDFLKNTDELISNLFYFESDINNLKATVKGLCTGKNPQKAYLKSNVDWEDAYISVKENKTSKIPDFYKDILVSAVKLLQMTHNPTESDELIDKFAVDYLIALTNSKDSGAVLYATYLLNKITGNLALRNIKVNIKPDKVFCETDKVDSNETSVLYLIKKLNEDLMIKMIKTTLKNNFNQNFVMERINELYE